jgi:M6 family metalloprotease-like protein
MKKLSLLIFAAVLMSLTASAVPVKRGIWRTLTLVDGTTVRAEARGSEYGSWWQDADGQCYVLQESSASSEQTRRYVKIDPQRLSENMAKNRAARSGHSRRAVYSTSVNGMGYPGLNSGGALPSNGEWDIPVLMVEFTDAKFKEQHTQALIQDYLSKEGFKYEYNSNSRGSVRDYFVAQSQGKFKPNFQLLGKVTINKSYVYYGKNPQDGIGIDENCQELPGDAMRAAKEQLGVDFTSYIKEAPDKWHDDGIPLICLLYAGEGEAIKPEYPDLIWPHQFDYGGQGTTIQGIIEGQGVHLSAYFVGNELEIFKQENGPDLERLMGIGVFVHELGHALGLPDWYRTAGVTEEDRKPENMDDAFGFWSVMDGGCYEDDGWSPVGYTAYERSYMGWLALGKCEEKSNYTLNATYGEYPAIYIPKTNDPKETEYFIVETRKPSLWYPESYGSGLMVTRYAYDQTEWLYDRPNNDKNNKRGMMVTANGQRIKNLAQPAHLFGNGVNSISGLKYLSGVDAPFSISNIVKNDDGSVSFDFDPGTGTAIESIHSDGEATPAYNMLGQRVDKNTRGFVIYKGRKYVNK